MEGGTSDDSRLSSADCGIDTKKLPSDESKGSSFELTDCRGWSAAVDQALAAFFSARSTNHKSTGLATNTLL